MIAFCGSNTKNKKCGGPVQPFAGPPVKVLRNQPLTLTTMKSPANYAQRQGVVYQSEAGKKYTYEQFLNACKDHHVLADRVFNNVEWEHPETEIEQLEIAGEIDAYGNSIDPDQETLTADTPLRIWWHVNTDQERDELLTEVRNNGHRAELGEKRDEYIEEGKPAYVQDFYIYCTYRDALKYHSYVRDGITRYDVDGVFEGYVDEERFPNGLEELQAIADTL
jgi:hypothetical protein